MIRRTCAAASLAWVLASAGCGPDPVQRQLHEFGKPTSQFPTGYAVAYSGTWRYFGHLRAPGEATEYRTRMVWRWDRARAQLDWTVYDGAADDEGETASTLVEGERVWHRDPDGEWAEVTGCEARWLRRQTLAGLPAIAVTDGARFTRQRDLLDLSFDAAHERLGDVTHHVTYHEYESHADVRVPGRIDIQQYVGGAPNEVSLYLASDPRPLDAPLVPPAQAPARPQQACFDSVLESRPVFEVHALSDRVAVLTIDQTDSRVLVVEGDDSLVVCEAPVSSAIGEALVDELARRYPNKPIATLLIGHHHPHYVGGVRAFIDAGALIVVTEQVGELVRELAARPFTLRPDRLAQSERDPKIDVFTDRWDSYDGRIVAYDIGERSNHTDEYVVFHVPEANLVFEGDLGWFTVDGETRASSRAAGLLAALDERAITVERLVQSWPAAGNPVEMTRAALEALIAPVEDEDEDEDEDEAKAADDDTDG